MNLSKQEKDRLLQNYGPWALVTGASSGIGLEISRQLASAGLNLVINSRRLEKLQEVESELSSDYPYSGKSGSCGCVYGGRDQSGH